MVSYVFILRGGGKCRNAVRETDSSPKSPALVEGEWGEKRNVVPALSRPPTGSPVHIQAFNKSVKPLETCIQQTFKVPTMSLQTLIRVNSSP